MCQFNSLILPAFSRLAISLTRQQTQWGYAGVMTSHYAPLNEGARQLHATGKSTREISAEIATVSHETVRRWLAGHRPNGIQRNRLRDLYGIDPVAWDQRILGATARGPKYVDPPWLNEALARLDPAAVVRLQRILIVESGDREALDRYDQYALEMRSRHPELYKAADETAEALDRVVAKEAYDE